MASTQLICCYHRKKSWIIFNMAIFGFSFYFPAIFKEDYAVCNKE